jgi:hypothetical protein
MSYNREATRAYAEKWAYLRNPAYYNFEEIGGDCTNFVSQCIYAGGLPMNYTKTFGWYYNSANDRAPAWSGVQFLYNFLISNKNAGAKGKECEIFDCEIGDVVQLSFDGKNFTHSMIVTAIRKPFRLLVATHSLDSYNRPLDTWEYKSARYIKITN